MNRILLYSTFIFLFLIESCIQAPQSTRKNQTSANSTSTTTTTTTAPTFATDEALYWYSSLKTIGTITINQNTQNVYYLRGSTIHNFLSSQDKDKIYYYTKSYCMVGNFNSTSYKNLRVRAVPIASTNSANVTERMLRLDFPVDSDNQASCAKSLFVDGSPAITTVYDASKVAFSLPNVCTTCNGQLKTKDISLFVFQNKTDTTMNLVEPKLLSTAGIYIQGDFSSNSTSDSASCSVSACSAKGFDCCIEGQCVKDGSYKALATSDPQYTQAVADYNANPLSFINWPNVFNICTNIAHPSVNTTTTTGNTSGLALATAKERVDAYLKSWYCMEDVLAGKGYARCIGKSSSGAAGSYDEVRYSLAVACGCTASNVATMDIKCPNWSIKPIYGNSVQLDANITDFYCYTPPPENLVGSITNLNVAVSSRSAPHRFFATDGKNYDDLAKLSTTIKQEGDEDFSYQDEQYKTGPLNGSFNSKSILGTMSIDLSKTSPAKMVAVELGKTYILTSTSGYFTPCPLCARDSWYQSFFARPTSQKGTGLQFSGYSTQRDTFSNNDTLGNYEDTHFGRACFIPLTMIPLSHQRNIDSQIQRLNRLKTQSAFYINGYQRDWYGFNQGALIGSFDGVTWFGVGLGRRITATSSKLFLAFNAPFLDLTSRSDTIVNIIPDMANNTASNVDYDPDLNLKNPLQGTAATCQKFHQCNTDAECISNLGWEYVCTDVSQIGTTWPLFDSTGAEIKNAERSGTLFDILSTTISTTYTKRCVYRGAGAPCKKDFSTFNSSGNSTYKKLLTCAPNFYCASVSSNKFNDELVRSPNEMDNILFGMDANVLGRPLSYVNANKLLTLDIISNITYAGKNGLKLNPTESNDLGMCRPGKQLIGSINTSNPESDFVRTHSNADSLKRTDYISQIGACNSSGGNVNRVLSCPQLGSDNNYLDPKDYDVDFNPYPLSNNINLNPTFLANQQNMCGAESKNSSTAVSAFKNIELGSLSFINSIPAPTLALDACLRRAGSICHTDLDCGPNIMHENIASSMSLSYFGGTEAERNYWSESLVCAQADAAPLKNSPNYLNYDMSKNRCCREIGKDFTMYTQGDSTLITDQKGIGSTTLNTSFFAYLDPKAPNRYSRYAISPSAFDPSTGAPDTASTMIPKIPYVSVGGVKEPQDDQWHVISETGSSTCCGGGWIRKFADGTHTWPSRNKLVIDASNFSCLNFRSPLVDPSFANNSAQSLFSPPTSSPSHVAFPNTDLSRLINAITYQNEYDRLCRYPSDGGCMQITYKDPNEFTILTPAYYHPGDSVDQSESLDAGFPSLDNLSGTDVSRMDASPSSDPQTKLTYRVNVDAPYEPLAYTNPNGGHGNYTTGGANKALNFFFSQSFGYSTHFYLPTYIGFPQIIDSSNITYFGGKISNASSLIRKVYIKYYYDQSSGPKLPRVQDITNNVSTDAKCKTALNSFKTFPADDLVPAASTVASWCISYIDKTQNRPVLVARADTTPSGPYDGWAYAGIVIDFDPIEFYRGVHTYDDNATQIQGMKVATPGNPLYYLSKLARLELLGIPQITYEPIYCNNDHNKLVPGLFNAPLTTRSNFNSSTSTYTYAFTDPIEMYNQSGSVNDTENAYSIGIKNLYYGNKENKFVYENMISHPAIFSSKDFTCCTPLGKEPKSGAGSCCSGFTTTKNNKTTCALPIGTDLSVYFNRFVSNEGVNTTIPGTNLISSSIRDLDGDGINDIDQATADDNIDFIPQTGEPKYRDSTNLKIYTLGVAYCSNGKVDGGSAFGAFSMEPFVTPMTFKDDTNINYPLSIVDSVIDNATANANISKIVFDQGFRWNNHFYCR